MMNKSKRSKELQTIEQVTTNLQNAKFGVSTNIILHSDYAIEAQITTTNDHPTNQQKITGDLLTKQITAFRQAITDLQGAGLRADSNLSLKNNKIIGIDIQISLLLLDILQ